MPFRLLITKDTIITRCRSVEDEDIAISSTPFLMLKNTSGCVCKCYQLLPHYYFSAFLLTNNFLIFQDIEGFVLAVFKVRSSSKGTFICGTLTDGTYRIEVYVNDSVLTLIPEGQKVRVFGYINKDSKNYNTHNYIFYFTFIH